MHKYRNLSFRDSQNLTLKKYTNNIAYPIFMSCARIGFTSPVTIPNFEKDLFIKL